MIGNSRLIYVSYIKNFVIAEVLNYEILVKCNFIIVENLDEILLST